MSHVDSQMLFEGLTYIPTKQVVQCAGSMMQDEQLSTHIKSHLKSV